MPAVARQFDNTSTGHGCDEVTQITGPTGGPARVYANNIPVECLGNPTVVHNLPSGDGCDPHTAFINVGSPNVFVATIPIARLGDSTDSGNIISASPNVYANS